MKIRDYQRIAGAIREQVNRINEAYALGKIDKVDAEYTIKVIAKVALSIADALREDNPRFKTGRFWDECGLSGA